MISKDYFKRQLRERYNEFVSDLNSGFRKSDRGIYAKWVFSSLSDFWNWIDNAWMNNLISTAEYRHYKSLYDIMRKQANRELDKLD